MKLPDFFGDMRMNNLRRKMGIPDQQYGSFQFISIEIEAEPLIPVSTDIERLAIEGAGKEVSFEELTILDDGTFAYKDLRVLIYIRDVHGYGGSITEPRYHFSSCRTVHGMHQAGRLRRFVVCNKQDGVFTLNVFEHKRHTEENRRLSVCQNCLDETAFDGFTYRLPAQKRQEKVTKFTPKHFFDLYPSSLHTRVPAYNWENSPLDTYTEDFPARSRELRETARWKCEECKRDFSEHKLRRFLHVHHLGLKSDNRDESLRVLCMGCHAEQPNHGHMKRLAAFQQFLLLRPPTA